MENKYIQFIVMLLIRKRLKLKLGERFQFDNQKHSGHYYFTKFKLMSVKTWGWEHPSSCSLNHLLSSECAIKKIEEH